MGQTYLRPEEWLLGGRGRGAMTRTGHEEACCEMIQISIYMVDVYMGENPASSMLKLCALRELL